MQKTLIYDSRIYNQFTIDEQGNVTNIKTNNILKKSISKSGYYVTTLSLGKRGKVKIIRNHKAVAETFLSNPNNYTVVHHKDGNKLNCDISNLEWTTPKINIHYYLQDLSNTQEYFNNRKLNSENVEFIRSHNNILSRNEMAKMFNVSRTTITNVCNDKYYINNF